MDTQIQINQQKIVQLFDSFDELYQTVNQTTVLTYIDEQGFREGQKKHWSIGDRMRITFNCSSSAAGNVNITVLKNGYAFKTYSMPKGLISIDLGIANTATTYVYTVSATDSLGRPSENTLTFSHILGGVTLTSTFENIAKDNVFSSGGVKNTIEIPASITYPQQNYNRSISYIIRSVDNNQIVVSGLYDCGTQNFNSSFYIEDIIFPSAGNYQLQLQGVVTLQDDQKLYSPSVSYRFSAINANTIATTIVDTNINTDGLNELDVIYFSYRVNTNITALSTANALAANCTLYKNGITVKTVRVPNISNGDVITWNIGRLSSGSYSYVIAGTPSGSGNYNSQDSTGEFTVAESSSLGSSYETNGLIAYFDPNDMDNADNDPSIWKAKNSQLNNYYYFKLHDLNYSSNGWIVDDDGSKMLKFTGDSYGELRYVNAQGTDTAFAPMSLMNSAASGNSLQIMFKTRCIGVSDAVVMTCKNQNIANYGGYSIKFNEAKISSNNQYATTNLVEQKWTHIIFVIDKNIRKLGEDVDNSTIEDMNPVYTMNIYVNGVRTKVISFDANESFMTPSAYPAMQMLLNAYYSSTISSITGFGACQIKTVRLYNTALKASQVLTNYINAQYDISVRQNLVNKNDANKANVPVIRFVRNKIIEGTDVRYSKYSKDVSFQVLNSITLKSSKDPTIATSKNSWVNCTMWYTYLNEQTGLWETVHYNDVDVYLQGTSSLQYPIKNYKIKIYNSNEEGTTRGKKKKIIPPNMVNKQGWYCEESTFTLKCDYMEQSHKNNTPTAMLYQTILDNVVQSVHGEYTPAKDPTYSDYYHTYETTNESGQVEEVSVRKYRDAVAGFPVLLYYNENNAFDANGTPIDYNALSTDQSGYYDSTNDVMVGTLMYNVDKTGKSLGFEIPVEEPYQVTSPLDGRPITYTDGTPFMMSVKPCISLQGSSNSSAPAAAAYYTLDQANLYIYKTQYLENIRINTNYNYSQYDLQTFYNMVQAGQVSEALTYEAYEVLPSNLLYDDIYSYISSTFEVRWAYTQECLEDGKKLSDDDYNELTYGNIIKQLEWIAQSYNDQKKFKNEFKDHFNLAYCITYYLQMMAFIQVDNAGKNAMFDQWGDGILHPRPYDMDTQMGQNNSGDDVIHTSAELNVALSPTGITGNLSNQTFVSNMATDSSHNRYIDYNTPNSKLWIAFGKYFRQEIVATYTYLRDNRIYDVDTIVDYVNSLTTDIIGQSFYNKDAAAKYLSQTYYSTANGVTSIVDNMLTKLQGDRSSRYRQVCQERLIFLDSFFGYTTVGNTNNSVMTIRSDAASTGVFSQNIGISVYSPCYITIAVGTDVTIVAYIDPDERYVYNGQTYEGVMFTLPIQAVNKDITIIGAANIKSINHMENLVITNFDCANAARITSIVITNSTALASLSIGANTYLRTVNVSGSSTLNGNINLSNCVNLKEVNLSDTKISSVSLPVGGAITSFISRNCNLTSLSFVNMYFLNEIDITGCNDIVSYEIVNCPKIDTVDVNGYVNMSRLIVSSCDNVTNLQLSNTRLSELSITNCNKLNTINLSGCAGTIMNELNLSTIYGLKNLNISSSVPNGNIKLFLPKYKQEYNSLTQQQINNLINSGIDVYWHELNVFNANNSYLSCLSYGIDTDIINGTCDFDQLINLTSLNIQNCMQVLYVKNLKYAGSLTNLFYNMQKLVSISGEITSTSSSMNNLFYQCLELNNVLSLTIHADNVTSATYLFRRCRSINCNNVKHILSFLPNVLSLQGLCYMDTTAQSNTFVIDPTLFQNNTKVTNLHSIFLNTNITTIPQALFIPVVSTVSNIASAFYNCTKLTSVPNNLIKYCSALTDVSGLFENCTSLETMFTGQNYDIFPTNSRITSTRYFFRNCNKLNANASAPTGHISNGLKTMFANLPLVSDVRCMFRDTSFITTLPETMFEANTNLTDMSQMFANCTSITLLPSSLFSIDQPSVTTHARLTNASGLFSGCTNMGGQITNRLLGGATNLTNIGRSATQGSSSSSSSYFYAGGMFANTKVQGYEYDFLHHLTKLTSISMLFFKGTISGSNYTPTSNNNNSTALFQVYNGDNIFVNVIYNGIFKTLTKLQDAKYVFAGNTQLTYFCNESGESDSPNALFENCKESLTNAQGLFAKCTGLSIDVPNEMFNNCVNLTTLRSCFADCTSLTGSISSDLFKGCNKLSRTDYMFYRCFNIGKEDSPSDTSVPSNLFDSCRNSIMNASYMFAGCGFNGKIGTGKATQTVDENGVITYDIERYGLLSQCIKLTSAASMFRACKSLKGAIPQDMFFTSSAVLQYNNLTDISYMFDNCYMMCLNAQAYSIDARNKRSIYGDELLSSDPGYLVPTNWLTKCSALTNVAGLFRRVSYPIESNNEYTVPALLLDDNIFYQQTKITNISYIFSHCRALAASLTGTFLQNSLNVLTNASYAFAFSNLKSCGVAQFNCVFEKNTSNAAINGVLSDITGAFYYANSNNMTGYGLTPSKFSALTSFNGVMYNQTKLNNFNSYSAIYKTNLPYYGDSGQLTLSEYNLVAVL